MKAERLGVILLIATVVSTLLIPSCKKKSEDPQPEETETSATPLANGMFTAKINGVVKTFGINSYMISGGVGIVISGLETGGTGITLGFFSTTPGTYDVDGTMAQADFYAGSTQHTATNGKIIITKVDNNKMSGTFCFEETGGVKVTDGVFTDVPKK
jgi:hypothetical protein